MLKAFIIFKVRSGKLLLLITYKDSIAGKVQTRKGIYRDEIHLLQKYIE